LNNDTSLYGLNANTTLLNLNFEGLGLPVAIYEDFNRLLSIITYGNSYCNHV